MSSILALLKKYRGTILLILILALTARVFLPQLGSLVESLQVLKEANLGWLLLGVLLFYSGIPVMAAQLSVLTFKKLAYILTLKVQVAALFINKLLPQGVGTISLNIFYFIKSKHTANQATTIMAVNAAVSLVAYILLIIFALLFSDVSVNGLFTSNDVHINIGILGVLGIVALIITLATAGKLRKKIADAWKNFKLNVAHYKSRPKSLLINLVLNGIGTSVNVLTLMCCAQAIGVDISFADALIAYTFGNIAATVVPTPGGIGSAEMGIYSGLVIVGVDGSVAITITLLYRLISYWLSIIPGYLQFRNLRKTVFSDYRAKAE
ncbi:MAG: lysylphosphatidylglycerol synthase transmembrane domain-containing protein [Candidatus Microsaccharimonas sp.]